MTHPRAEEAERTLDGIEERIKAIGITLEPVPDSKAIVLKETPPLGFGEPLYFFPFALGNLLGPLLLGHLFDSIGRRKMILGTYDGSGVRLFITALLFNGGLLTATTQTVLWCVIYFFTSAGASSAYLTVSEIFPLELRGQAGAKS